MNSPPPIDPKTLAAAAELGVHLSQGVKDVVVFDPGTLLVLHVRRDGARRLTSPVRLALECGCEVEV